MTTFPYKIIDSTTYELVPNATMADTVSLGETFRIRTRDASGGQINEGATAESIDHASLFPIVGPINVTGVRAGDTIGIRLRSVTPLGEWGHTWTRPGLGFGVEVDFHARRVNARRPVIGWGAPDLRIPLDARPHVGAIGVLPAGPAEPRSLGHHGGNLDFVHLGPGATIWLTAAVDGAGLFLGDVHIAIGDAEVCGTGVEVDADVELTVLRHDPCGSRPPIVTTPDRAWVIGVGDTFDDALAAAVGECVTRFADAQGVTRRDAYLAVGLLLDVTVCQVVNPRRSVAVTLRSGMDRVLRPPNSTTSH